MPKLLPGILLAIFVAMGALIVAPFLPYINAILLALILGMILANFNGLPTIAELGIAFSSKKILEWSIVFMGFGIQFSEIAQAGTAPLVVIFGVVILVLLFGAWQSSKYRSDTLANELITFGTAICGTSAIAALAPKINASKSCIGVSIAIVNLYGLLGMILLPLLLITITSPEQIAIILGATLHGVGNVTGAAYNLSTPIGNLALTVKLTRVALLAPALIVFASILKTENAGKKSFSLPYYVVGFIIASIIASTYIPSGNELIYAEEIGNYLMVIAMGSIGMHIKFSDLLATGKNALLWGGVVFIFQIVVAVTITYTLVS